MNNKEYILSGVVEQYVLGLCNEAENAEIEMLRKQDPALNEAILNFEIQFEQQMMQHQTLPLSTTDDKILSGFREMGEASPVVAIDKSQNKLYSIKRLNRLAVAATLLLGTSVVFNVIQYFKNESQSQELLASAQVKSPVSLPIADFKILQDPTITPIAMYGVGSHAICRCTMFWDKKTGNVYVMIHHLPKSNEAKDYQLWANVAGKQISVGIINDAIRDKFIEMNNMPAGATSFIVTLEKAGGATVPTENEIYLEGKI